jgi:hypothetical protein
MITSELVATVKRIASTPTGEGLYSAQEYIDTLNEFLRKEVTPLISSIRQEFFLKDKEYTILADENPYPIPSRAVGSKINQIYAKTPGDPDSKHIVQMTDPTSDSDGYNRRNYGWYLKGNNIMYNGSTTEGKTMVVEYECRPSTLIEASNAALITAISGNDFTVSSVPSSWSNATLVDVCQVTPQFDLLGIDQPITINSNVITTTAPTYAAVGDYLSLAGTSPIAHIPIEAQLYLTQGAACMVLESNGDKENLATCRMELDKMYETLINVLSPRVMKQTERMGSDDYL